MNLIIYNYIIYYIIVFYIYLLLYYLISDTLAILELDLWKDRRTQPLPSLEAVLPHHTQQEEPLELVQIARAARQIRVLGLLFTHPALPTQAVLAQRSWNSIEISSKSQTSPRFRPRNQHNIPANMRRTHQIPACSMFWVSWPPFLKASMFSSVLSWAHWVSESQLLSQSQDTH